MPLLGADDAAGRTDSELFYYFLALALWVLVAVLAVLAWPYYLWLRWRRRRKEAAKAEKSRQPVAEDAHSTEKKARQIGAPREDHKA
jgi:type VI protein secretion system component VasK